MGCLHGTLSLLRAPLAACALVLWAGGTLLAQSWPHEQTSGPFLCHADFSLAAYRPLISEMALLQKDVTAILGVEESREPVHLFLFQNKASYQAYMRQYFPKLPYRRALFIKGRGPGMVFAYRGVDFEIDVRHESTHALLHASLSNVPLWLDEGLAEYFEVPRDERAGENPHLDSVRAMIRFGQVPRLEELEAMQRIDEMGRDEYRDAWAWVHFMLHGPQPAHDELVAYLAELAAHRDAGSLSQRLRRRFPDLQQRLVEHFRR